MKSAIGGLVVLLFASDALAGFNFTGTPDGSWAWFEQKNAGYGANNNTFYPTLESQFDTDPFQGYVTYNPRPTDPPYYFFGDDGNDLMEVFRTYVLSSTTQTLAIQIDGDDGHSLFVNGSFVTGGPFGALLDYNLTLTAGVPVEIELVDHNGPGPWYASLSTQEGKTIDSVPGITLNADGKFAPVPEPSSMTLLGVGLFGLGVAFRRRFATP